jgi:hypothetical protein
MAHSTSISHVGDKLIVGILDTSFLTATTRIFPGTAVLNGPVYIGLVPKVVAPTASCMIGPSLPGTSFPASLEVNGITNILGAFNVVGSSLFAGAVTITGVSILAGAKIANSVDITNGLDVDNSISISNLNSICHGTLVCNVIASPWLEAQLALARALPSKSFDIPHPTKPNTHRLRYVCLEGPETGAYIRGKLKSNIIELPDYWKDLVYEDSISVFFTPIGEYQQLYVEKIENGEKIYVQNRLRSFINCDYIIYGERKTKDKLIPEYEGTTPDDYPGSNDEYSIVGWNYDRRMK